MQVEALVFAAVALVLLGGLGLSLMLGAAGLSLSEAWAALLHRGPAPAQGIVHNLRLPRALVACVAGTNLAVSGFLLQRVTRNPLADPGLIGITAGGAVAATIVLAVAPGATASLPLAAFVGALAAAVAVYAFSWQPGVGASPMRMVLAGVAINAVLGAVIGMLVTAFAERVPSVMFWMNGSFNGRSWPQLRLLLPYSVVGLVGAALLRRPMSVLELGDDAAQSMGVPVARVRLLAFVTASVLAGSAVAVAGVISFVGLVVPHLVRLSLGGGHPRALVATAVGGAGLLLWADLAARTLMSPSELPVGVVTAVLGGPYFLFLLCRAKGLR